LPSSVAARAPNQVDPGLRPIGTVGINIAQPRPENMTPDGIDLPDNLAAAIVEEAGSQRFETEPFKPWGAYGQLAISSNFCHRPLYFEDVNLERYGRSWGAAQPFVSAGKFFATVPLLPYKMVREPPHVCQADVGPPAGTPAPRQRVVGPLEVDAALVEAAVVVGLILLIP
jgi:hypothetical protein